MSKMGWYFAISACKCVCIVYIDLTGTCVKCDVHGCVWH